MTTSPLIPKDESNKKQQQQPLLYGAAAMMAGLLLIVGLAVGALYLLEYPPKTNFRRNLLLTRDPNAGRVNFLNPPKPRQDVPTPPQNSGPLSGFLIPMQPVPPPTRAPTSAPTNNPTAAPTASPTCAANLNLNFTTLTVINLQVPIDYTTNYNTRQLLQQLGDLYQSTYNRINNARYTTCSDAYRHIQSVRYVGENIIGNEENELPSSFLFRRALQQGITTETKSSPITTHNIRIGNEQLRRIQQESTPTPNTPTAWAELTLLYEVTVACKKMYCIGSNAELFSPSIVVNKYQFSKAYSENVAKSLVLATDPFRVDTVREIEETSCPTNDEPVEFERTVIIELVLPPQISDPFVDPDDPRYCSRDVRPRRSQCRSKQNQARSQQRWFGCLRLEDD